MPRRLKALLVMLGALAPAPMALGATAAEAPVIPGLPWWIGMAVVAALGAWWHHRALKRLTAPQQELQRREAQLRHALEGSEDGFWDWDLVSGRIDRSERWTGMLGYAPHEIAPTAAAAAALVHPDDLDLYQAWQARLLSGAADRHAIQYRMKSRDGDWRWILDRGKIVSRDASGRPLRMAGTHTDISKSKSTEAALVESQAMLKRSAQLLLQTQSAARVGGWETDLRTGCVYWTSETYRIHETTPEEFHPTRESLLQFYVPESRLQLVAAAERAVREGQPYGLELELVTTKQRRLHVHTTGVAEWEDGRVVKLYGSFRDITAEKTAEHEREKLQRKMVEAQKLESLGVLAGGIAHDFNNLLTIILANAELIRQTPADGITRLANIESAGRRAADLCRQMLAYAGKARFVVERIDLATLVHDTTELVRVSLGPKIQVELALTRPMPAVEGDVSQLRQVVMNLVLNAGEALDHATGRIRIATTVAVPAPLPGGVFHSFDLPAGPAACLEVSDTGIGMSEDTLTRIFDPFFTTKFTGRGLGLAAVLGIVRTHRGALAVESHPGRGSVFRLYLPLASNSTPAPPPAGSGHPFVNGCGTILIADDEPAVLDAISRLVECLGFDVVAAADGADAVDRFHAEPRRFRSALLDLTMPRLDGAEAAAALRRSSPALPLFVMSGLSEHDVATRLRDLPEIAIIHKPLTAGTLTKHLSKLAATS